MWRFGAVKASEANKYNMKLIATWSFEPFLSGNGFPWLKTEHFLTTVKRSIDLAAEHYSKPTIYTDSLGCEVFSQLTTNANYVNVYDGIFEKHSLDHRIWILPKLLTYKEQTEPYLHFDLDFLFLKKLDEKYLETGVLVHNLEYTDHPQMKEWYFFEDIRSQYILPEEYSNPNIDTIGIPNLGVLYLEDMAFNQEYVNAALDIIENNKQLLNTAEKHLQVINIEQRLLGLLFDKYSITPNVLLPRKVGGMFDLDTTDHGEKFVHICGPLKWDPLHLELMVEPWITPEIVELANRLDAMKQIKS